MNTLKMLEKLTSVYAVSGREEEMFNVLYELLKDYGEVSKDDIGNIYCTFGEGYHFLLDAHIDEIGFIVKAVSDDGFIKVSNVGGIDRRMLLGSEVVVHGKDDFRGIISTLPPHLQKGDDDKAPEIDDISIDIGMTKENAEKVISPGDRVTFKRNFNPLLSTRLSSSCLDDRCGVAAIILALEELKGVGAKVTAMFSVQEEVGTRGAKVGPYAKNVDEAIAIDVSFGYTPSCKKSDCGELGKGPMIGVSPILDKNMSDGFISVAEKNGIPYQIEVMGGGRTGTDADVISISESGIKTGLISIPEKYMHSPIEVIDTDDVENTARLISAYVKERAGEINA